MTYRAEPVTQRDGSPLANSNCLMAAAAVGLDFHTLGGKTSTGAAMRDWSGDSSGGTNTDEIERAWHNGYSEDPTTRDGRPWSDVLEDLEAGRLVMLQVWHATVGGPCLSGSGAYGHGLAVAPERDGDRWLVADPWCKPASWKWVQEDRLRAGAIEWADRCSREAGGRALRDIPRHELRVIVRYLFALWTPDHPAPADDDPPEVGGAGGVLFASTRPQLEARRSDVSVNTNGSKVTSARYVDCPDGLNFYGDAGLEELLGELPDARALPFLGPALGEDTPGVAVLLDTVKPYTDGVKRPTIVYVNPEYAGEPYVVEPEPGPPSDDVAAAIAKRDAEWRAWIDGAPEPWSGMLEDAEALLMWSDAAPDHDA